MTESEKLDFYRDAYETTKRRADNLERDNTQLHEQAARHTESSGMQQAEIDRLTRERDVAREAVLKLQIHVGNQREYAELVVGALTELMRLKDMKDDAMNELDRLHPDDTASIMDCHRRLDEHDRAKPFAWETARAALAKNPARETDPAATPSGPRGESGIPSAEDCGCTLGCLKAWMAKSSRVICRREVPGIPRKEGE